jgi:O-antigen ligase
MIHPTAVRRNVRLSKPQAAHAERTLGEERLALGAMAATIAFLPVLVPRGPGGTAPLDVLVAASLCACLLWAGASSHRWRFPYVVPMGLFLLGGMLGALAGSVPVAGLLAVTQDAVLLAWAWALANLASSSRGLKTLAVAWVYSAIAWAIVLFVGLGLGSSALTGQTPEEGSRTTLTFGDPNVSANYYFISFMLMWATGYPRHRVFRMSAYALLVAALISTGSNSGVVSLALGITVAGVLAVYRRAGVAPAVAALAVAVVGGYFAAMHVSLTSIQQQAAASRYAVLRDGIGHGQASVSQRDTLVQESVLLYHTGGPFGQGPASTKPRLDAEMAPLVKEAHNDYLAGLLERGAVGLIGVLLLVASVGWRSLSVCAAPLRGRLTAAVVRPNALAGAVAGTLVAAAVYELLHLRHVWALFALVAAAYGLAKESSAAKRSGDAPA